MVYSTLSTDGVLDAQRRGQIDDTVRRAGGTAIWRSSERASRTYALLELPGGYDHGAMRAAFNGVVYDKAVIALALFPTLSEALPFVTEALGGAGRPAGILACRPCPGGAVVEWDPDVTEASIILGIADIELSRFASARVAELLSPLPPSVVAKLAASGLKAPEIEPRRILELRINRA
ncbi:MAG: hypothetical protein JO146_04765 [Candidatus Eremiobacteraeota bacterium]|nr:hypothetical protein [Candidatus Eremiobacteraeota bacterium]